MNNTYVAIMAGGIGSRFWPQSRTKIPKQFLDIMNTGHTLIQMTYERALKIALPQNILVVTNEDYVGLVNEQLPDIHSSQILAEPVRRNTAPCIAYVCSKIHAMNNNATIVVVPSDHLILNESKYLDRMNECIAFTRKTNALITLGIKPSRPSTGYGYIQFDEETKNENFYKVITFAEKPDAEMAQTFYKSGEFLWNSGMFVWKSKDILDALHKYLPEVGDCFNDGHLYYNTDNEKDFISKAYSLCTNISIDYGVMEKADNVYTIPSEFGWSDIGSWKSLYEAYQKDYLGNAVSGKNVRVYDSSNNMIMMPDGKLLVVQGIRNLCIIDTEDVLLICDIDKEQEIKQITMDLKQADLDYYL
jgi:mannose-1-phosphate guanylyltransferase